jgi:hypothetical protein
MWKENWNKFIEDLKGIPSKDDSNEIAEPITTEKIAEIEQKFRIKIPPKFKKFLMTSSGGINIWWDLEDGAEVKLKDERESIVSGYFNMSMDEILEMNFRIEDDYGPDEDDLEIHPRNLLAFAGVENGDQFAVVHSGEGIDSIKYISLDLEDVHLYTVGEDINTFLSNYARIGFAGCEFWIWEQFTNQRTTPIDSESHKATEFLDAIKGGVRSAVAEEQSKIMEFAMEIAHLKLNRDAEGLVRLLSDYKDTLSGEFKEKLEKVVNVALHDIEAKDVSDSDAHVDGNGCPFCGNPVVKGLKTCDKDECIESAIRLKL